MRSTRPVRRIAGAVVAVGVAGAALAVPASATSLSISRFTATPTSIAGSGGTVTFTIRTTGATSCRLASSLAIAGLPAAVPCTTSSKTISVPASTSSTARTITFTLTAAHGTQHKSAQVTVSQAKAVAPMITTLTSTPTTVNADTSTQVSIKATTKYARTCTVNATPSVLGLPFTAGCSGGTFAHTITVPATPSASPRTITLTFTATGPSGRTASRSVSVTQPGAGSPSIASLSGTPTALGYTGGALTVTGTVAHARTCMLSSSRAIGSSSGDCSGGTFSHQFSVPGNSGKSDQDYTFTLTATSPAGFTTATTTVTAHPRPTLVASITSSPVSVPAAGATLTVSADVHNATTCSMTSDPDIGSDSSIDCTGGTVSREFTIPQNTANSPRSFTFTVAAGGVGPGASATLTVTQPAAPPSIATLSSSATPVPAAGGTLTVSGEVSNATTCEITRTGYDDPASVLDCRGGTASRQFDFLSNTTESANHYFFTLTAFNADGSAIARADVEVRQPQESGASSVSVDSISASSDSLPDLGRVFTVTAQVSGATSCSFSSPDIADTSDPDCSSGTASAQFTIPPNLGATYAQYTFNIVASGATPDTGSLTVYVPPPLPSVTSVSVVPATVAADGGEIDISAETVNAHSCKIAIDAAALRPTSCNTTGFSGVQKFLPANTSGHSVTHTITVQVSDDAGTATGVVQVPQAAASP